MSRQKRRKTVCQTDTSGKLVEYWQTPDGKLTLKPKVLKQLRTGLSRAEIQQLVVDYGPGVRPIFSVDAGTDDTPPIYPGPKWVRGEEEK